MYITRHMEHQILSASRQYPVVMVCGQRQVGKSTMLYHIKESSRRYVTLDDGNARRLAANDPALFFETYGYPLLIDEFQRVPSILLEIKKIVDEKALSGENSSGMFWLTGSQKFQMMKNISESLAGRVAVFELSGFSSAELESRPAQPFYADPASLRERMTTAQRKDVHMIFENIFRGGMPKICTGEIDRERYYTDYVNTYLERDVRDLSQVGKINEFYSFLVYMAARTGREMKYEEIARNIGVSSPTAKAWVSILEQSGILYVLHPYSSNITKRLVRTPKAYFMDTGLAAFLCRWPDAQTLENGAMDGAFLETYAVTEIIKSYHNCGKNADLFYYRDIDRKEIDLLLVEGNKVFPIVVKKGKDPAHADKNFGVLNKLNLDVQPGLILCMSDELIPYSRDVWYCPISVL